MSNKKIVYCSNTGHTKRYAELLGNKLNIEVIPVKEIKKISIEDEIIYMGWVFADNISKLKKIRKYNVIATIAVGMSKESIKNTQKLIELNKINTSFFYLQGGVDYTKLKGIKKKMLQMVGEQKIKENKKEDQEEIEIFKNGGNFVKEENLKEIVNYIKNRNI